MPGGKRGAASGKGPRGSCLHPAEKSKEERAIEKSNAAMRPSRGGRRGRLYIPELGEALPGIARRIVVVVTLAVAGAEGLEVLRGGAAREDGLLLVGGGVATLAAHMVRSLGVVVVVPVWLLSEGARGGRRRVGAGGHRPI
jgi:hypothetical protein